MSPVPGRAATPRRGRCCPRRRGRRGPAPWWSAHDGRVAGLRAPQLLLGAPQLGDVADEAGELPAPLVDHRHRDQLDDQGGAVAADGGQLEALVEHRALARRRRTSGCRPVRVGVLGGDEQLAQRAAEGLLAGPAEQQLGRRVELDDPARSSMVTMRVQGGRDDGSAAVGGRVRRGVPVSATDSPVGSVPTDASSLMPPR